jgi:hypothetical protein
VGKTELAREFAFLRQRELDAVFWIEAVQATLGAYHIAKKEYETASMYLPLMADMEDARASMDEVRKLYADVVPSRNRRGSELTAELLVAAVPLLR